ncbi:MAG: hypothetical protein E7576_07530 [Ruminococcaceae bacterium]|nr:hypothetical protein [Oscillospiraceae bacterium]
MKPAGRYVSLDSIRLAPSRFADNMARDLAYLRKLDPDRMLYNFRKAFGVPTEAEPLYGWDEETGLLRGHSAGHFLSALAIAVTATGDHALADKLSYMIHELRSLQLLSRGRAREFVTVCTPEDCPQEKWSRDPSVWGEGFLSAYSPDQFALLEQFTPYAKIWAPYYTLHKIAAGLIEAYERTGNEEALASARGIGDWVCDRLSALTPEHRRKMWSLYIAGEYGGMNESMARLALLTGEGKYLDCARLFDNENIFPGLSEGIDTFQGLHANQHIPQIMGAMLEYEASDDPKYRRVARSFLSHTLAHHMYAIGGVGQGERFHEPDALAKWIKEGTNCETCATYNLLKLARELYAHDPEDAGLMDYYERGLYNHILASQNPFGNEHETNAVTYMLPIGPGAEKEYSNDWWAFTCCHGTGMENHVKYPDAEVFRTEDTVYLNQFIPCVTEEDGFALDVAVSFPEGRGTVTACSDRPQTLKLRIPLWCGENPFRAEGLTTAGRYASVKLEPGVSVTIGVRFRYRARFEFTPDLTQDGYRLAALLYGPFVMVTEDASKEFLTLDADRLPTPAPDRFGLWFCGRLFIPMYEAHGIPYHTYFKLN